MASKAIDNFDRPDSSTTLGVAETGQPWKYHRTFAGGIKSGRAVFSNTSPGSMCTVDTGVGGGDARVRIDFLPNDGGGQALYFRAVDANRWWRLSIKRYSYTYTYQSGTTEPTYSWVGDGTYRYEPAGGWSYTGFASMSTSDPNYGRYEAIYFDYDSRIGTYRGRYDYSNDRILNYQYRQVFENQSYQQTGGGYPIYSTATAYQNQAILEVCKNSVIYPVKAVNVGEQMSSLSAGLNGDIIACYGNDTLLWESIVDPTHKFASQHGIGYSESSPIGNVNGIEKFSAEPFVITEYIPPMML